MNTEFNEILDKYLEEQQKANFSIEAFESTAESLIETELPFSIVLGILIKGIQSNSSSNSKAPLTYSISRIRFPNELIKQ